MVKVEANISMSLDGFVTGPNLDRFPGLGEGGEVIQAWVEESRAMDFAFGEERQIAGSIIASRKVYDETGGWAAEGGFFRMPVLFLHVAPVILNSGTQLFEHLGGPIRLERAEVIESRHATHLRYRILN